EITETQYYNLLGLVPGDSKANIQMGIWENCDVGTTVQTSSVANAVNSLQYVVSVTQELTKPSSLWADILIPLNYCMFESRQARIGNKTNNTGGTDWMV